MGLLKRKKPTFSKVKYEEPEEEVEVEPVEEELEEEVVTEEKRKIVIVKEIPMQPLREVKLDDGTMADLYTIEEYLTKLANEEEN